MKFLFKLVEESFQDPGYRAAALTELLYNFIVVKPDNAVMLTLALYNYMADEPENAVVLALGVATLFIQKMRYINQKRGVSTMGILGNCISSFFSCNQENKQTNKLIEQYIESVEQQNSDLKQIEIAMDALGDDHKAIIKSLKKQLPKEQRVHNSSGCSTNSSATTKPQQEIFFELYKEMKSYPKLSYDRGVSEIKNTNNARIDIESELSMKPDSISTLNNELTKITNSLDELKRTLKCTQGMSTTTQAGEANTEAEKPCMANITNRLSNANNSLKILQNKLTKDFNKSNREQLRLKTPQENIEKADAEKSLEKVQSDFNTLKEQVKKITKSLDAHKSYPKLPKISTASSSRVLEKPTAIDIKVTMEVREVHHTNVIELAKLYLGETHEAIQLLRPRQNKDAQMNSKTLHI